MKQRYHYNVADARLSQHVERGNADVTRHEERCARNIQDDTTRQTSNDVFSNTKQGDSSRLQKVHAISNGNLC
ncbi:hypothetical protein L2E82_11948 [Cichorium intybus]|uniref:Uncharacterized protein n=1 Tax=Cichorium intybus TaxID=13427 RepID=A0ACB9GEQ5_CICIN|nr:hypothetical protein L2E82_11948 [Cichorium intybus]